MGELARHHPEVADGLAKVAGSNPAPCTVSQTATFSPMRRYVITGARTVGVSSPNGIMLPFLSALDGISCHFDLSKRSRDC